jgi:glycerol-3-phosphate dehydrogenase
MGLKNLKNHWDIVVIGGGITGAGILREASRMGYSVLLVEQKDFAWGTSSRSSKLVHGGLRYLKEGKILLTRDSVLERERLVNEAKGLVDALTFLMPVYKNQSAGKWTLAAGLSLYSLLANKRQHKYFSYKKFSKLAPILNQQGLTGGFRFLDAQVDDARLVLRLIQDTFQSSPSSLALNYTKVTRVRRNSHGRAVGVIVEDTETNETKSFSATAVINATGSWAERLHPSPTPNMHLRPLRGSHLIFPAEKFPLTEAISIFHPKDNRPIFAIPWEGATLFGTTDIDHQNNISKEPSITKEETDYLIDAAQTCFPSLKLTADDCLASFAGIRPVLSKGNLDPSQESREHVVWVDNGLITVTGGKMTTFRLLALDTLKSAKAFLPEKKKVPAHLPIFENPKSRFVQEHGLDSQTWQRLYGRYGEKANLIVENAEEKDLQQIPGTHTLWAELPYVAKQEQVRHLSDLLLRRVRIGILTSEGGKEFLPRIKQLCQKTLKWDDEQWDKEVVLYQEQWKQSYSVPK